jgi:hypothetical protein
MAGENEENSVSWGLAKLARGPRGLERETSQELRTWTANGSPNGKLVKKIGTPFMLQQEKVGESGDSLQTAGERLIGGGRREGL